MILLHPAHRKIVRLMKLHVKDGGCLIYTQKDLTDFIQLIRSTDNALKRHRGIYRILLRGMQTQGIAMNPANDTKLIDMVETIFAKAERQNLSRTIRNVMLKPILIRIIRWMK